MPSEHTQIELALFIPRDQPLKGARTLVDFLGSKPRQGWAHDEGHVRWVVNGVALLDESFNLYPWEQIEAVVSIALMAASGRTARVNVPGSIIDLTVAPIGVGRVRLGREGTG